MNKNAVQAKKNTYEKLKTDHSEAWQQIWDNADIQIEGDINAQQAIRFNIFQLFQTYNGKYSYLNIGPKDLLVKNMVVPLTGTQKPIVFRLFEDLK